MADTALLGDQNTALNGVQRNGETHAVLGHTRACDDVPMLWFLLCFCGRLVFVSLR